MRQKPLLDVEQPILNPHDGAGQTVVEPARLVDVVRQDADCAERFDKIADLAAGRRPRFNVFLGDIERMLGETIEQGHHRAPVSLAPVRAAPSPPPIPPIAQGQCLIAVEAMPRNEFTGDLHRVGRRRQDRRRRAGTALSVAFAELLVLLEDSIKAVGFMPFHLISLLARLVAPRGDRPRDGRCR